MQRRRTLWTSGLIAAVITAGIVGALLLIGRDGQAEAQGQVSSASCAASVQWRGISYLGTSTKQPFELGAALGHGTVPPCNDTIPATNEQPTPLALARVVGIPPERAVASGDGLSLYVAPGYFPQLPHTELHDLIYGPRPDVPDERPNDCGEGTIAEVHGRVRTAYFGVLFLDFEDAAGLPEDSPIFPQAQTKIVDGGPVPHVDPGDEVQAEVVVCRKAEDPHFLKLVAKHLTIGS